LFGARYIGSTLTPSIHISRKPTFGSDDHFACMTKSCQWPRSSVARLSDARQVLVAWSTRHMQMLLLLAPL